MRAIGLAVIVLSLTVSGGVFAFEEDMHYYVTFQLALVAGWNGDEAHVIASAAQAVDENWNTTPALEFDASFDSGPSPKNIEYHCFSESDDDSEAAKEARNPEVEEHLEVGPLARAESSIRSRDGSRETATRALVAIGVALHCLADSWSHSGYGKDWEGHGAEVFYRQNPDHPAFRPYATTSAIEGSLAALRDFQRLWSGRDGSSLDEIEVTELVERPCCATDASPRGVRDDPGWQSGNQLRRPARGLLRPESGRPENRHASASVSQAGFFRPAQDRPDGPLRD